MLIRIIFTIIILYTNSLAVNASAEGNTTTSTSPEDSSDGTLSGGATMVPIALLALPIEGLGEMPDSPVNDDIDRFFVEFKAFAGTGIENIRDAKRSIKAVVASEYPTAEFEAFLASQANRTLLINTITMMASILDGRLERYNINDLLTQNLNRLFDFVRGISAPSFEEKSQILFVYTRDYMARVSLLRTVSQIYNQVLLISTIRGLTFVLYTEILNVLYEKIIPDDRLTIENKADLFNNNLRRVFFYLSRLPITAIIKTGEVMVEVRDIIK